MPEEDQALIRQLVEIENELREQPSLSLDRILSIDVSGRSFSRRNKARIKLLRVQSLIQLEYFEDARNVLLETRTLLNSKEDEDLVALFQSLLARLKYEGCDPIAALGLCDESILVLGREPIDPQLAVTLFDTRILAAYCCEDMSRHSQSIEYLLQAMQLQQRFGIAKGQLKILHCLGRMYLALGQPSDAKECAQAAMQLTLDDPRFSYSHYLLATCHLHLGQIVECLDVCASSFIERVSSSISVKAKLTIAKAFSRMGEYVIAQGHLATAFEAAESMKLIRDQAIIKLAKARVLDESGDKEAALHFLKQIENDPANINILRFRYQVLYRLAHLQQELGMFDRATETFTQLLEVRYEGRLLEEQSGMLHEHDMNSLHSILGLPPLAKGVDSLADLIANRSGLYGEALSKINEKIKTIEGKAPKDRTTLHEISIEIHSLIRDVTIRGAGEDRDVQDRVFRASLLKINPRFTSSELKVCAQIREDKSSSMIAYELGTSVRTIDAHRLRIRKKLGLTNSENLHSFLLRL